MPFVFSFGSNLDEAQMRHRCPSVRRAGRATLPRHRLVFVGHSPRWGGAVATVERDPSAAVLGALDLLSHEDLAGLDAWEGGYRRVRREVVLASGQRMRPYVYLLDGRPGASPSAAYLEAIARGYRKLGYSLEPLRLHMREAS